MLLVRLGYFTYNAGTSSSWLSVPPARGRWVFKYSELFSLVFDAAPMCLVFIAFAGAHPGRLMRRDKVGRGGAAGLGGRTEEFRLDNELAIRDGGMGYGGNRGGYRGRYVA